MIVLRIIGIVLALGALVYFLVGLLQGNSGEQSTNLTYAIFAALAGLMLAMAADAGQKLEQKSKEAQSKKTEKK